MTEEENSEAIDRNSETSELSKKKKIGVILAKVIAVIFLLKARSAISSLQFEYGLDDNFPTPELWNSMKLYLELLVLGSIFCVMSFSLNKNSISKIRRILIWFSIGWFLSVFMLVLFTPFNSWYVIGWQLSLLLFLIFRQLSALIYVENPKISGYLLTTSYGLNLLSLIFLFGFTFYS